jgi:hypothetical protein
MRISYGLVGLVSAVVCACSPNGGTNDGGTDAPISDAPGDAPNDSASDAGDGGPLIPQCSTTETWGTGTLIGVSTPQSDFFGAVTSDELTIAWMTTAGSIFYSDRASTSVAFGAPQTLSGAIALDHVSLSTDGLTLIFVKNNRYTLEQSTRASRSGAFSTTFDSTPYSKLDPPITEFDAGGGPTHGLFSDPMLSPDGQFLYYSEYGQSTLTMYETYRASGDTMPWGEGRNLLETQLGAPDLSGKRMHPTGIAADDLTLFYWDDVASTERMAFRDDAYKDNTYKQFVDIGAHQNAAPVTGCARIYFSGAGTGGFDLFFADKN